MGWKDIGISVLIRGLVAGGLGLGWLGAAAEAQLDPVFVEAGTCRDLFSVWPASHRTSSVAMRGASIVDQLSAARAVESITPALREESPQGVARLLDGLGLEFKPSSDAPNRLAWAHRLLAAPSPTVSPWRFWVRDEIVGRFYDGHQGELRTDPRGFAILVAAAATPGWRDRMVEHYFDRVPVEMAPAQRLALLAMVTDPELRERLFRDAAAVDGLSAEASPDEWLKALAMLPSPAARLAAARDYVRRRADDLTVQMAIEIMEGAEALGGISVDAADGLRLAFILSRTRPLEMADVATLLGDVESEPIRFNIGVSAVARLSGSERASFNMLGILEAQLGSRRNRVELFKSYVRRWAAQLSESDIARQAGYRFSAQEVAEVLGAWRMTPGRP